MRLPLFLLLLFLFPSLAISQEQPEELLLTAELLRSWPLPAGTSPFTASVDSTLDGTTLLLMSRGDEDSEACVIVVSSSAGARAFTLRYDLAPTRCVDATPSTDGGFFVRGVLTTGSPDRPAGFTLRASPDGEILWSFHDEDLLDLSPPPSGPGTFQGSYDGPLPGLHYNPESDLLLTLTLGVRRLPGSDIPVTQAQVFQASTGSLRTAARTFGGSTPDNIVSALPRFDEFLVHTLDGLTGRTRFFRLLPDGSAPPFEPGGLSWDARDLVDATHHPDQGTFLLWTDSGPGGRIGILAIDLPNSSSWNQTFPGPGRASRIWVGRDLLSLRYRDDQLVYALRLIAPNSGEDLGLFPWQELVDVHVIDMIRLSDGSLGLLAADAPSAQAGEFSLSLGPPQDLPSLPDNDDPEPSPDEGGCSSTSGAPSPLFLPLLFALLFAAPRLPRPTPQCIRSS